MLEQPDSPSVSETKKQLFDHYLYRLQSEIHTILSAEDGHESRIQNLENELNVFKRACFSSEAEKCALTDEVALLRVKVEMLESEKNVRATSPPLTLTPSSSASSSSSHDEDLEQEADYAPPETTTTLQACEKRLACIIDGNETLFSAELIAKGVEGGQLAAKQLSESILFHLTPEYPYPLWVTVFYDKSRAAKVLSKTGKITKANRTKLEEFVDGFNRSCERFLMVDVSSEEDALASKVEAQLDYLTRSQDTVRIVFGGCQSPRYAAPLQSLLQSFREKLVLLQGDTDMAEELANLQLPSLVIPNLFVAQKHVSEGQDVKASALLSTASTSSFDSASTSASSPPSSPSDASSSSSRAFRTPPPPPYNDHEHSTPEEMLHEESVKTPVPQHSPSSSKRPIRVILGNVTGPVSYRPHWSFTNQSGFPDDVPPTSAGSAITESTGQYRRLDRSIPLNHHSPPPCLLHYLARSGCKHGSDCRFGHDYLLDDDDIDILKGSARKIPCPAVNKDDYCVFGDSCCYGHTCPYSNRCAYFRQGRCKFNGSTMHLPIA